MIKVTGLDHKEFIINAEQIEIIEAIPECVITLISGKKYIVTDTCDEIIEKVVKYKNRILIVNV